jgi:hypothetical protein
MTKQYLLLMPLLLLAACGDSDTASGNASDPSDTTVDTALDTTADTAADTTADTAPDGSSADTTADTALDGSAADTTADTTPDTAPDGSGDGLTPEERRCERIRRSIEEAGFGDKVSITCDATKAQLTSNTFPDHDLMNGITATNEQIPVEAPGHTVPVLLAPTFAPAPLTVDGALGVAVNGVPIYDYSGAGAIDTTTYDPAVDTLITGQLDRCGGHSGRGDDYHYHAAPVCMIAAMPNRDANPILGWGFDGFPMFGDNNPDGSTIPAGTLDDCNGQPDTEFGYRYHTSVAPPYVMKCLKGQVDLTTVPRVPPLSQQGGGGGRPSGRPPAGGVQGLVHRVEASGLHAMEYTYNGRAYYLRYTPRPDGCFDFETSTVTANGVVETGVYCR